MLAKPAEVEGKAPKKRRKPLANCAVANGIAPQRPAPPAPAPALVLLPNDHAIIVGWQAAPGGDGAAAPTSGLLSIEPGAVDLCARCTPSHAHGTCDRSQQQALFHRQSFISMATSGHQLVLMSGISPLQAAA